MLPVTLDLARLRLVLVGNGAAALRRLRLLDEAGAREIRVYADAPVPELAAVAGKRLRRRLPSPASFEDADVVFLAGLDRALAETLTGDARARKALVNAEDETGLCDFHSNATLRRGDLVVAVSTGGRSPGLASRIRRHLEQLIGPEWQARLDEIAHRRAAWREAGADPIEIGRWTDQWLERQGWLKPSAPARTTHDHFPSHAEGGFHVASSR
jgi:precorrin-2 dehydrogenase/sirohydrochlorin ferrochelatase